MVDATRFTVPGGPPATHSTGQVGGTIVAPNPATGQPAQVVSVAPTSPVASTVRPGPQPAPAAPAAPAAPTPAFTPQPAPAAPAAPVVPGAPQAYQVGGQTVNVGVGIEWARFALAAATLAAETAYREELTRTGNAQLAQQASENALQRNLTDRLQSRGMDLESFRDEVNNRIQTGELDLRKEHDRWQKSTEEEKLAIARHLGDEDTITRRLQINNQMGIATDEIAIKRAEQTLRTQIQTGQLGLSQRELDEKVRQGDEQLAFGRENLAQRRETERAEIQLKREQLAELIRSGDRSAEADQQRLDLETEIKRREQARLETQGDAELQIRRDQLDLARQLGHGTQETERERIELDRELGRREQARLETQGTREQDIRREIGLGNLQIQRAQLDEQIRMGDRSAETAQRRLDLDTEISRKEIELKDRLGTGGLALERELGTGRLGIEQRAQALKEREFAASLRGPGDVFTAQRVMRGQEPGEGTPAWMGSLAENTPLPAFQGATPGARVPTAAETYGMPAAGQPTPPPQPVPQPGGPSTMPPGVRRPMVEPPETGPQPGDRSAEWDAARARYETVRAGLAPGENMAMGYGIPDQLPPQPVPQPGGPSTMPPGTRKTMVGPQPGGMPAFSPQTTAQSIPNLNPLKVGPNALARLMPSERASMKNLIEEQGQYYTQDWDEMNRRAFAGFGSGKQAGGFPRFSFAGGRV